MTDRRAHFILQGKGGIGKSFVASLLAQFYLAKGAPVQCIDTDPLNGTLSGYKGLNAKRINIVENNRVHARLFDDMMEDVLSADASSVVDVGGASFIHLVNYMVENRAFETIAEAGIAPTVHSVVVGGQPMVDTLEGRVKQAANNDADTLAFYRTAVQNHPHHRALVYAYAEELLQTNQAQAASKLLGEKISNYPDDTTLYQLQARSFAKLGKNLEEHQALAYSYAWQGNLPAAIEQLELAKQAGGTFYQLSSIESDLRELHEMADEQSGKK